MSWGAAGLSMSVAGEVGIGIRSPAEESWPLLLCEGGDVGPSLLAENTIRKNSIVLFYICLRCLRTTAEQRNSRVPGLVLRPRLRPGVDAGEDIVVGGLQRKQGNLILSKSHFICGCEA